MPIGVEGRSYFDVSLDGRQLPLEQLRFGRWLVTSHLLYHMPMGELVFIDPHDMIAQYLTVADGTEVKVRAGLTQNNVYEYTLRVYNVYTKRLDQGVLYRLSLIDTWDVWRLQTAKGSYRASSADALQRIATFTGLTFDGVQTNDNQVWLPLAEPYSSFARRIASLGYIDAKSCMAMGVTLGGQLRYRDINSLDLSKPMFQFVHGAEDGVWVTDWALRNNSGSANQTGGYATVDHQFSVVSGERQLQNKAQVRRLSDQMNLNTDVKPSVGDGRVLLRPIDAGNNHANAQTARYQNSRVKQLLSSSVSLVTPMDPDIDLLEPVNFRNFITNKPMGTNVLDRNSSGLYLVAGKTIHIGSNLHYNERYQLIREGQNADNSKKVT